MPSTVGSRTHILTKLQLPSAVALNVVLIHLISRYELVNIGWPFTGLGDTWSVRALLCSGSERSMTSVLADTSHMQAAFGSVLGIGRLSSGKKREVWGKRNPTI